MKVEVEVDHGTCESNGVCVSRLPEIFDLRRDDTLHLHRTDVPTELVERAHSAVIGCPRQVIRIVP